MSNRGIIFAGRNLKELLRDPLSYIFCIGFPIIMLGLMTLVNGTIPPEANMVIFKIENLAPGISVFGLSFIMLFATLSVSKDRSGAFLNRLYSSPMKGFDFIVGYTLPLLIIYIGQFIVTYVTAFVIAAITGGELGILNVMLSCVSLIPCAVLFIGIGIIFGTILGEKGAPPCSSIIITMCGVMGGIWFDLGSIPDGNTLKIICKIFPFAYATDAARAAINADFANLAMPVIVTAVWAVALFALAVVLFRLKMKSETK